MMFHRWIAPIAVVGLIAIGSCGPDTSEASKLNGCWYVHDGKPSSIGMLCECEGSEQDFLLKGDGAIINAKSSFDIYEDRLDLISNDKVVHQVPLVQRGGFLVGNYEGNEITIRRLDTECSDVYSEYTAETKLMWTTAVLATDSLRRAG